MSRKTDKMLKEVLKNQEEEKAFRASQQPSEEGSLQEKALKPVKDKIIGFFNRMSPKGKRIVTAGLGVYLILSIVLIGFNDLKESVGGVLDIFRPQDEVTIEEYDKKIGEIISNNEKLVESKEEIIEEKNELIEDKQTIIDLQASQIEEQQAKIDAMQKEIDALKK